MSETSLAIRDEPGAAEPVIVQRPAGAAARVELAIYDDLEQVEDEWRAFEAQADCTVFQHFDWLVLWHHHIGVLQDVSPAIVVGRAAGGAAKFLLPLAVVPGIARRLVFLGCEQCDYNAPLLAKDFATLVPAGEFARLWGEICQRLQARPEHRHDILELTKMPAKVGAQDNPFLALDVELNPSGAHLTQLAGTWDEVYRAKRSSETRRRDRTKRKRLSEFGEVRMVTPQAPTEIMRTLQTLFAQKAKSFARMGVANLFERPGCMEFFVDLATNPHTRHLVHVSRLDVGDQWAAINLGLVDRDCYYHVLASYDDGEASRFGPGAAHLRDLMAYAIAAGKRRFDFTIGDERYKTEWADTAMSLYDHVSSATARGWPLATLTRTRRQLKRTIKQNPVLWEAFSRMRAAARAALPGRATTPDATPQSSVAAEKAPGPADASKLA
jgi:CelD/BcsL family acetyltransferase involved in cellulose biosynthesis